MTSIEEKLEERIDIDEKRLNAIEAALGAGGKGPEKGIAQRLDDLEERIEALEGDS